jgi:fibronectin-binding autotransporter adhesin
MPTFTIDDNIVFCAPGAGQLNTVIAIDRTIGSLTFSTNATGSVTIKLTNSNNAGKILTVGSASVPGSITIEDPGVAVTHYIGGANVGQGLDLPNETTVTINGAANRILFMKDRVMGVGSIKKEGTGTLQMANGFQFKNSYSGGTTINGGMVIVATTNGCLGEGDVLVNNGGTLSLSISSAISDTNNLSVAAGGQVYLSSGVNETVYGFVRDGVVAYSGVYGASGSGAMFNDDTIFSGTGTLTVLAPDPPAGTVITLY